MAEPEKRKGGGKLARSETVTVRLDPKLRYLAELAARKQRRTLSSFIEWAVEDSLSRVFIAEGFDGASIADEAEKLWDVDEADRFAKLALRYPYLLTHDEQVVWKLVCENGYLWRGRYAGPDNEMTWSLVEESLIFDRLRETWNQFIAVAQGQADKSILPTWPRTQVPAKSGFDDIPF